jgi:hypothetical protein
MIFGQLRSTIDEALEYKELVGESQTEVSGLALARH